MIKFNVPAVTGQELEYIKEVIRKGKFSGNHEFSTACGSKLKEIFGSPCFITPSGTHALEMAGILANIKEGDEVIMSSFTFTSTANAFVLRGARIVFIDIRPDTMNLDEQLIEKAITEKTRAIAPMHYGGIPCEMDRIMEIARERCLFVIEDAAQAFNSTYKGKLSGTFGQFGCFSFHETKNIQCGEGGALFVNDPALIELAEMVQEKGTDRKKFFRGQVDKYRWVEVGSSYLLSEINAAFLLAQLDAADDITAERVASWTAYYDLLSPLAEEGFIELPIIPATCSHNGHIFYIKAKDLKERTDLLNFLKNAGIGAVFHYLPLHTSPAGRKYGRFSGKENWTTRESERLLRLPLYYKISLDAIAVTVRAIFEYYKCEHLMRQIS